METYLFTIALALVCVLATWFIFSSGFKNSTMEEGSQRKKLTVMMGAVFLWILYISILAGNGLFQDWDAVPPNFFKLLVVPALAIISFLVFSGRSDNLIRGIDGRWLIYVQSFRIGVEILLWMLHRNNQIPVQMSFEGRNFDILVGLTAPFAGYVIYKNPLKPNRTLWLLWNLFGLGWLLNIVTIAILSTPVPFRVFMNEPVNTIVATFPYVFIPGVFVTLAYTMHFMSLRKWFIERNA